MHSAWYIAACIIIPAVWGISVAAIYERLAAHRKDVAARPSNELDAYRDADL